MVPGRPGSDLNWWCGVGCALGLLGGSFSCADLPADSPSQFGKESAIDPDGVSVTATSPDVQAPGATEPGLGTEGAGCVTAVGEGEGEFHCEGIDYRVSAPSSCLQQPCGLIADIHGGTMNGRMQNNNTELARLGTEHGFVVVHPSAPGGLWTTRDDVRVVAFLREVIDAYWIDPRRVHLTGFSQGGFMTWRLLCSHGDLFASVAPGAAAGTGNISPEVGCTFTGEDIPAAPLDVLYLHGRTDALVNFDHWSTLFANLSTHWMLDAGEVVGLGDGYTRTRYEAASGHGVEFIAHDYTATSPLLSGHCFPGSDDQSPREPGQLMGFGCVAPNGFHWGEEVVEFFLAHPRR